MIVSGSVLILIVLMLALFPEPDGANRVVYCLEKHSIYSSELFKLFRFVD